MILNWNGNIMGCCFNFKPLNQSSLNSGFENLYDKINCKEIVQIRKLISVYAKFFKFELCNCSKFCPIFNRPQLDKVFKIANEYSLSNEDLPFIVPLDRIYNIRVEFSTHCQISCDGCWRNSNRLKRDFDESNRGYLTPDNLKILLDQLPNLNRLDCTVNGESLLNPHFVELLKICYDHRVSITGDVGFNFNRITKEQIEAMIDYNFKSFIVSIDGASQETYSRYRVNGNFDKIIENIKLVNQIKKSRRTNYPYMTWKMIGFSYNLNEIDKAYNIAKDLDMKFELAYNIDKDFDQLNDSEQTYFNKKVRDNFRKEN